MIKKIIGLSFIGAVAVATGGCQMLAFPNSGLDSRPSMDFEGALRNPDNIMCEVSLEVSHRAYKMLDLYNPRSAQYTSACETFDANVVKALVECQLTEDEEVYLTTKRQEVLKDCSESPKR